MRYVILVLLTPFTAFGGFLAGVAVAMALGLSLHDNYEYFSPDYGVGIARVIGVILCYGGALFGSLTPWLCRFLRKQ